MRLLLDTHVWFWILIDPRRLGRRARSAVARPSNEVWLSPISVWELLVLAERSRVELDERPARWVREALERSPVREAALTHEVALLSREMASSHPDPADRFLMATAAVFELTPVTADDALLDLRLCPLLRAQESGPDRPRGRRGLLDRAEGDHDSSCLRLLRRAWSFDGATCDGGGECAPKPGGGGEGW